MTPQMETGPDSRRLIPFVILLAASLALSIPLIRIGLPFGMDASEHLSWYRCFAQQLWSGEVYPRWLLGMNGGLGSPDFFVYGPLPYYAATLFHVLTSAGRESAELAFSFWLALALSGVSAYILLKDLVDGIWAPTIGALVYMMVPYHIKTDLYTRVALAEFWALAWMPLLIYFARRIAARRSAFAAAGFGISYALLLTTHLFTTLMFSPVPLLYVWVFSERRLRLRTAARTLVAMALGSALASFYVVPALSYQKYISAYKLIETRPDYLYYRNFLFSGNTSDAYLHSLSWTTAWTAAVAAGFFLMTLLSQRKERLRESVFWAALAGGSVFMMLPVSIFIWKALPPLQAIQFPSRLNTILTLAVAVLAALAADGLRRVRGRSIRILALGSFLLAIAWSLPIAVSMRYQHPWIAAKGSVNLDYLITAWAQWTDPKLISLRGIPASAWAAKTPIAPGTPGITQWKPRSIAFLISTNATEWIAVKQFYFPGWVAESGGRRLPVRASSPEGLVEIQVPAGANQVRLRMPPAASEIAGALISAAAIFALLLWRIGLAAWGRPA